ncbi:MAG TPA: porin [Thermoanaerobaculia bacterium]|jgi:hypothetical protein
MKRTALLVLVLCSFSAFAQEKAPEKPVVISGYVIGDYYSVPSHHLAVAEGQNGFWLRRGYLTFDKTISDQFSARLRFEINQPGDFRTNANLEPFVKDAYVRWKQSPKLEWTVGISPTPTFEVIERIWGYRSVERTPVDLHRLASSRDFGIALTGGFDRYRYHVMAGNGSGVGSETNDEKKVAAAFSIAPTKSTLVELYADREARPGDDDRSIAQVFAALQLPGKRVGAQFTHQDRARGDVDLASVFGVADLRPNVSVLARVDRMFDPSPEGDRIAFLPFDTTSESTLFIAGVDYKLHKNVSIIPNVEYIRYDGGAEDDILLRLTFFYSF